MIDNRRERERVTQLTQVCAAAKFATSFLWAIALLNFQAASAQVTPASPATAPQNRVLVVCPPAFRESLQPWIQQRQTEQLTVQVIPSESTAAALQKTIQTAASTTGDVDYVLLVGDAPVLGKRCDIELQVPTFYPPTTITEKWGSTPNAPSDAAYSQFKLDGTMDAAVGRLPVHTAAQLQSLVSRILAYEHSDNFGSWRREVQLTGGVGGFGPLVDTAIESVTRTLVTSQLPPATKTCVAYASPGHMFCPTGASFTDEVLSRYQRGARFWVYAGHGWIDALDRVPATAQGVPVLDSQSVQRLRGTAGVAPIALMLACYTGAFDAPQACLGEQMLLAPAGPIAVFAGSRMTMPYGNTVTAVGLIDAVYQEQSPRLGDAWLSTLKVLHRADESEKPPTRMLIDSLATMVSPAGTVLVDERREHAALYNLLGDPTLRMHHPQTLTLTAPTGTAAGETLAVDVESSIDGELELTVDRPLGAITQGDPNNTTIATLTAEVIASQAGQHQLHIPTGVQGPLIIRALVRGTQGWATAATRTLIR